MVPPLIFEAGWNSSDLMPCPFPKLAQSKKVSTYPFLGRALQLIIRNKNTFLRR